MESEMFISIRPQECFGLAWSKKNKERDSPNILKLITRRLMRRFRIATVVTRAPCRLQQDVRMGCVGGVEWRYVRQAVRGAQSSVCCLIT